MSDARWPDHAMLPMTVADLDKVLAVEAGAYSHPWTRGNFIDSLAAGHWAELQCDAQGALQAYFVAMPAVDELHLLNLTVSPAWQGQGLAHRLLDHLGQRGRAAGLDRLLLEVRQSNARAQALYLRRGFVEIGVRKAYYPAPAGRREDAIVMALPLHLGAPDELD